MSEAKKGGSGEYGAVGTAVIGEMRKKLESIQDHQLEDLREMNLRLQRLAARTAPPPAPDATPPPVVLTFPEGMEPASIEELDEADVQSVPPTERKP